MPLRRKGNRHRAAAAAALLELQAQHHGGVSEVSEIMTMVAFAGFFAMGWVAGHNFMWKRTRDDAAVVATIARHMQSLDQKMRFVGDGMRAEVRMTVQHRRRSFDIVVETPSRGKVAA
jgi:hypothetical protein